MEFLHPAMWHDHDIDFVRWLHPAMWHVAVESWQALGWHAIEFAQTSAILEFYIWFRFRPYHCSRHVILHHLRNFIQIDPIWIKSTNLGRKIWRHVDFQDGGSQDILDFRGPLMGSLKSPCTTSYRSSIDTVALNCLVFEKIALFVFWRQTDRQTKEQMDSTDAWSRSRCRERWLNKMCKRNLLLQGLECYIVKWKLTTLRNEALN